VKQSDFESLQRGMAEANAFRQGERQGFIVHEPVDVRRVRTRMNLTRQRFASLYGLDSRTVEQWEQGRRKPDTSTETYLRLIEKEPEKIAALVSELPRSSGPEDAR
jgi:putative transcriptional regulator